MLRLQPINQEFQMSAYSFFRNIKNFPALLGAHPTPVGIFGLPRGGTNFISAWLHYHPNLFCVSERCYDWHKPLYSYWRRRSLFRYDGIQDKNPSQIERIIFNKVQRFPELWGADVEYPHDTKFIFYLRNPIRIHMSREAFRSKHEPVRSRWADSRGNFLELLADVKCMLDSYHKISLNYPSVIYSHEHFCLDHAAALTKLYKFLDLADNASVSPNGFFQECGRCGKPYETKEVNETMFLYCSQCDRLLEGHGHYNPLRKIDLNYIVNDEWQGRKDIDLLVEDMNHYLGPSVSDYYLRGDYSANIVFPLKEGF